VKHTLQMLQQGYQKHLVRKNHLLAALCATQPHQCGPKCSMHFKQPSSQPVGREAVAQ
jgi:hypothetical protein